jgi:hypothetical protein
LPFLPCSVKLGILLVIFFHLRGSLCPVGRLFHLKKPKSLLHGTKTQAGIGKTDKGNGVPQRQRFCVLQEALGAFPQTRGCQNGAVTFEVLPRRSLRLQILLQVWLYPLLYLSLCSLYRKQVGKIAYRTSSFNVLSRRVCIPSTFRTSLCTPMGHACLNVIESPHFVLFGNLGLTFGLFPIKRVGNKRQQTGAKRLPCSGIPTLHHIPLEGPCDFRPPLFALTGGLNRWPINRPMKNWNNRLTS